MDDERFIQEVQFHSVLYDTTHPFYKDNSRKERAWVEVATALQADVCDCKTRWRNLRDTFVKHRKRLGVPNGSWPQKDWKYSELMSFLLPFVVQRASKRKAPPPAGPEGEGSSAPLSPAPSAPPAPAPTPPHTLHGDRGRRSRSPRDRAPSWAERRPRVPESDWDEAYHFCLSVVPQLLRLNWRRRHTAKIEILRVLERLRQDQEEQLPLCPRRAPRVEDSQSRAGPRGPGVHTERVLVKQEPQEQRVKQEERPPQVCVGEDSTETHVHCEEERPDLNQD